MKHHYGTPEFALVFCKGKCKPNYMRTICDRPNVTAGAPVKHSVRSKDGTLTFEVKGKKVKPFGRRGPIWRYSTGGGNSTKDRIAFRHPAIMAEKLAEDLIVSFSRPGDVVFDPMAGSGTTLKMAVLNHRKYLGIEIHEPYVEIAKERVRMAKKELQRRLDEE